MRQLKKTSFYCLSYLFFQTGFFIFPLSAILFWLRIFAAPCLSFVCHLFSSCAYSAVILERLLALIKLWVSSPWHGPICAVITLSSFGTTGARIRYCFEDNCSVVWGLSGKWSGRPIENLYLLSVLRSCYVWPHTGLHRDPPVGTGPGSWHVLVIVLFTTKMLLKHVWASDRY